MRLKYLTTCLLYLSMVVHCFPQQSARPDKLFCISIWDVNYKSNERVSIHNVFVNNLNDFHIDYSNEDSIVYSIYKNSIPAAGDFKKPFYLDSVMRKNIIGDLSDSSFEIRRNELFFLNWYKINQIECQNSTPLYVYPSNSRKLIVDIYLIKAEFFEIPISCLRIYRFVKKYLPDKMQSSNTFILDSFEYVEPIEMLDSDIDTVEKCVRFQYRPRVRYEWSDTPLEKTK